MKQTKHKTYTLSRSVIKSMGLRVLLKGDIYVGLSLCDARDIGITITNDEVLIEVTTLEDEARVKNLFPEAKEIIVN